MGDCGAPRRVVALYGVTMRCATCGGSESKVIDSRSADDDTTIRRRRQCMECEHRFTTFERLEEVPLTVVKRDGEREPFDRDNIVAGLRASAVGRPFEPSDFERIASAVEDEARLIGAEVSSEWVGIAVLEQLRSADIVAALRFASVYKGFTEAADFERELRLIKLD